MVTDFHPTSLEEALALKKDHPEATLYSGGSDLMVTKRFSDKIIFLNKIEELKKVENNHGVLTIGAGAVYNELLKKEEIPEIMKEILCEIASPAIRNVATMGGNICNASPAGDSLPLLYVLEAKLVLESLTLEGVIKQRIVPIDQFILGIRKIDLKPEEILTGILISQDTDFKNSKMAYKKVAARKAQAISKLQFIGMLQFEDKVVSKLRMAFGAVGVTVVRKKEIEEHYLGLTKEQLIEKIPEILKEYEECIHPIDDQRSTAEYRKKVCLNLIADFLS